MQVSSGKGMSESHRHYILEHHEDMKKISERVRICIKHLTEKRKEDGALVPFSEVKYVKVQVHIISKSSSFPGHWDMQESCVSVP